MITMHEKLWEGVELKISNAEFLLDQMGSLRPWEQTSMSTAYRDARRRTMALVGSDLFIPTLMHFWRWAEVFPRS